MSVRALCACALALAGTHAAAQGYPSRAIRVLIDKALALPALRTRLEELGYDASGGTVDDYARLVRAEIAKWDGVIRKAGIRIE